MRRESLAGIGTAEECIHRSTSSRRESYVGQSQAPQIGCQMISAQNWRRSFAVRLRLALPDPPENFNEIETVAPRKTAVLGKAALGAEAAAAQGHRSLKQMAGQWCRRRLRRDSSSRRLKYAPLARSLLFCLLKPQHAA